jgi:hypothetical protein
MKEPYGKGDSESILASSLAGDIARYRLKRRQRYRWTGLLSFEKPMEQDADSEDKVEGFFGKNVSFSGEYEKAV